MDPALPSMVRSISAAGAVDHDLAQMLREVDSTAERARVVKKKQGVRSSASASSLATPAKTAAQQQHRVDMLLPPLQLTAPVKKTAPAWSTPAGDMANGAKTVAARVRMAEPSPARVDDAALDVSQPLRSPTYSPRRTAKLAGTTLTSSLEFVERDLSLNRAAAKVGKGGSQGAGSANVTTAEAWLEDMLELIKLGPVEGEIPSEASHGMERAMVDRTRLQAAGMDVAQVGRLYQLLFVHSFGMHQSISAVLEQLKPEAKAEVAVRPPPRLPGCMPQKVAQRVERLLQPAPAPFNRARPLQPAPAPFNPRPPKMSHPLRPATPTTLNRPLLHATDKLLAYPRRHR